MDEDKDKKEYEIAFLVATEADVPSVLGFIGQHGGETVGEPKSRNLALAYEIKKHKEAVFAYCNFRLAPNDAKTLEQDLNTRTEVLRSLMIASPAAPEKAVSMPGGPMKHRTRSPRTAPVAGEASKTTQQPLSNEALEKKIEEILQ